MGLINLPNSFSPNTTIDSSDVNDNFSTIVNTINGNLDANNLGSGVITASKIADGTITADKLVNNTLTDQEFSTNVQSGWNSYYGSTAFPAPNTVTCNGNRSYDLVFNSVDLTGYLSPGMRLQLTRTVSAPTKCTSLNGSTQYYSKSSPNKLTFTDDFTCMGWVKLSSYAAGGIIARRNADTEGWSLSVNASGQVLIGGYRIASNNAVATSYQSLPLNKWVHVAASYDLSGTDAHIYIDGIDVPLAKVVTGTATAIVQGTTALVVGAEKSAGTNPFPGKIAQAAVFSSVLSASTIRSYISQGLAGNESTLLSAYSFNNAITDLNTTTPNDLSAQGSAVATNSDSPFALDPQGTPTGTTEYAIITKTAFSTNTTVTVQVPEGGAIPTSGGVSTVRYSTQKVPYGFPVARGKYQVQTIMKNVATQSSPTQNTWYNLNSAQITIPIGSWATRFKVVTGNDFAATGAIRTYTTLSDANNTESDPNTTVGTEAQTIQYSGATAVSDFNLDLSSQTVKYLNTRTTTASVQTISNLAGSSPTVITAELVYV